MVTFDVASRELELQRHYLLEASAGTGKTYSIENIAIRLLIDRSAPCTLEEIALVTFTRAAVADLKKRIHSALSATLEMLVAAKNGISGPMPDYLSALCEEGVESIAYGCRQIESALTCFEQAPIFTIHGFCCRMLKEYPLEGGSNVANFSDELGIPPSVVYSCIKDFFRCEIDSSLITPAQLQRLISRYRGVTGIERSLYSLIQRGMEIAPGRTPKLLLEEFTRRMKLLQERIGIVDPTRLVEDFACQAPLYKNICDRKKQPKAEHIATVHRFGSMLAKQEWTASDLDLLISEGLYLVEAFAPENLGKGKTPSQSLPLHYRDLQCHCQELLWPIVLEARHCEKMLATLAHHCQQLTREYNVKHELMGFNDILTSMLEATDQPPFVTQVQKRYRAAIIDEFQDTDPVQWEIFKRLFLSSGSSANIYLVGDPKQSIYGFRQADIYTYLAAGDALGQQSRATLNTNYRSTSPLIEALNALFSEETAPAVISLPRLSSSIPYLPVHSGGRIEEVDFSDERGAIHFCLPANNGSSKPLTLTAFEEELLLPFIADELCHLHSNSTLPFSRSAILVADRFQGARAARYLASRSIPYALQRSSSLVDSPAFAAFRELLQSFLTPREDSCVKLALGGPLIGWTVDQILTLELPEIKEQLLAQLLALRRLWWQQGFACFFRALMQSYWHSDNNSLVERLLATANGLDLYRHLRQLAELLMARESCQECSPHQLVDYLVKLQDSDGDEDPKLKLQVDHNRSGVRIVTMHSSKGLEYDIVFALGVLNRSKKPDLLVPEGLGGISPQLIAVNDENDPRYIAHCQELDAEKIRQLYVAFTRAKQRLYIPIMPSQGDKLPAIGTASPIELYLAHLPLADRQATALYDRIATPLSALHPWLHGLAGRYKVTFSELSKGSMPAEAITVPPPNALLELSPALEAIVPRTVNYLHSFTALAAKSKGLVRSHPEATPVTAPQDYGCAIQNRHTLPAGSEIGILLHAILEVIPFSIGANGPNDPAFSRFVEGHLRHTPFASWLPVICEIIHSALHAELPVTDPFTVSNIATCNCYREHEFVYITQPPLHGTFAEQPGYVKGVIDLMFTHKGKYYLLDWKSNWLGPTAEAYGEQQLLAAMSAHDYFLQAKLYRHALASYLALFDPRPFEELFGGIFFLFLRGLSSGCSKGIVLYK